MFKFVKYLKFQLQVKDHRNDEGDDDKSDGNSEDDSKFGSNIFEKSKTSPGRAFFQTEDMPTESLIFEQSITFYQAAQKFIEPEPLLMLPTTVPDEDYYVNGVIDSL